jgi:hypothetical protein
VPDFKREEPQMKVRYWVMALGMLALLSGAVIAAEPQDDRTQSVTQEASASARKLLAQLRVSMKKIDDMMTNEKTGDDLHAEVEKARKAVDDAVDRVSVTGGRGTQRNFSLRQMAAQLEKFAQVVGRKAEAATKAEYKNLKAAMKQVEASFSHK